MQRSAKIALAAVVVVIVGGGLAFWWFVLRDDAPPPATLPVRTEATTTTGPGGSQAGSSLEGTWTVTPASDVFVGYRIEELFGGETLTKTAVGRTPGVSGSLTIAGDQVTAAQITADMSGLSSDSGQRDSFIRGSALETSQFDTATFTLTQPIQLPSPVVTGEAVQVTATGDLTLHGVTRPVEVQLQASFNGSTISVAGGTHVVLADYAIEPPDIALVKVEGEGELELQLVFAR